MKKILLTSALNLALLSQSFASLPCAAELENAKLIEKVFTDWAKTHMTGDGFDDFDMQVEPLLESSIVPLIEKANISAAQATELLNKNQLSFFSDAPGPHQAEIGGKNTAEVGPIMERIYPTYAKQYCKTLIDQRGSAMLAVPRKTGKPEFALPALPE